MKNKAMTHSKWKQLHLVTAAQTHKADNLAAEMRELSQFGNLRVFNDTHMFIIARNGNIIFQGRIGGSDDHHNAKPHPRS